MTELTRDAISLRGAGIVTVTQYKRGVRFTLDSILLADFCRIGPRDRVLEPGAGAGVVSLLLAKKFPDARFVADEGEPLAYGLLAGNIRDNGLSDRIVPVERDLALLCGSIPPETFHVIVANPPYTKTGTGRTSPVAERHLARHDAAAPLDAWLGLQSLLKNRGTFFLVFTARRAAELCALLREQRLEPKRLRFVHPRRDKAASLVLVEARKHGGTGCEVLHPLVVHGPGGGYTEELLRLYEPS